MSRVTYTPYGVQAIRNAGDLNAIYTDIAGATNPISDANLAEEGIDQQVVVDGAHADRRSRVSQSTRTVVAPQVFGVLNAPAAVRTGALGALLAGSYLRIRTWIRNETSNAAPAGFGFDNVNDNYEFRHAWFDGAATTTVIAGSRHARGQIVQVVPYHGLHGGFIRESWLVGAIANIAYVELQYQNLGLGNMHVDQVQIEVTEFKRMSVI